MSREPLEKKAMGPIESHSLWVLLGPIFANFTPQSANSIKSLILQGY
jgi:hypothetical protein